MDCPTSKGRNCCYYDDVSGRWRICGTGFAYVKSDTFIADSSDDDTLSKRAEIRITLNSKEKTIRVTNAKLQSRKCLVNIYGKVERRYDILSNKLETIAIDLLKHFPCPTGNLQRDFRTFQMIQEIIYEMYQQRNERWDGYGKQREEMLSCLLEKQKEYMEEMLYGE